MGSLYSKNSINEFIIDNEYIDWIKIIEAIFYDTKYKFCLNSELIDIDSRFRIVKIHNKVFIIKKTTAEKAQNERNNAIELEKILYKKIIDNYKLKPIIPTIINIGNDWYIISEYKGYTLQESLYDKRKSKSISFSTFSKIILLFMENGIIYRGFIPRNMIIRKNNIYMIDFEDITINNNEINLQYITNLILNWQYFYPRYELEMMIEKYGGSNEKNIQLLPFENCYKEILGCNCNNYDLRLKILNTVLYAEKPINQVNKNNYIIMPNDLVHLMSDLYGSYVDVIIDLYFECLRKKSEEDFNNFIDLSSNIIKYNYSNVEILKKELLLLLIKSIKIFINNGKINKKNINIASIEYCEFALIVSHFLNTIQNNTDSKIKQQIINRLQKAGKEYELF